jgi:hypothetical protein
MKTLIDAEDLIETKSRSYRMKHVNLKTPCILDHKYIDKTSGRAYSPVYRKALAELTNTTIPIGHEYHACHACNDGRCINPKHIYWGTPEENSDDLVNYYNKICEWKSTKWVTKKDILTALTRREYDKNVSVGLIQEMHEITNPIKTRTFANICDTIHIEIPEDKKNYYANYTIKVNPHKFAKPKKHKQVLLERLDGKHGFHRACILAITLHYANHPKKERGWLPTELIEEWVYAWDRGELRTRESLYALYEEWKPNNLVFYPIMPKYAEE